MTQTLDRGVYDLNCVMVNIDSTINEYRQKLNL